MNEPARKAAPTKAVGADQLLATLPVSEVFVSLQGEGPRAGRIVTFIRLGGCNLACSWCDTPYTWDHTKYKLAEENPQTSVVDLMQRVEPGMDVVITGGEPLIHQARPVWAELLRALRKAGCHISIETNGTIAPSPTTMTFVRHYSVSPKLANAGTHRKGQDPTLAVWPSALRTASASGPITACLKFVCADGLDANEAVTMADCAGWGRWNVWLMPEGRDAGVLAARWPEIASSAIVHQVNACQRLHVLAWGDTKGT